MNLKCSPTPLQHQNDWPRGGCGRLRGGYGRLRSSLGTRPDLAGVPDGLCRGKEVFLVPGQTWPASLTPSEASETFSGVFWSFPRPRKRSAACFGAFRGLGNVQRRVLILSEASGRLRPPAKFSWYPASLAGIPDGLCRGKEVLLVPGQLGRRP